jgi:hypothetical protein
MQQGLPALFLQQGKEGAVLVVHLVQQCQLAPFLTLLLL